MATSSPSSSMEKKSDDDKLRMLDRMLTRLALSDDSNLEALLSKLLPLSISYLSSQSVTVRNKVIELLSHVNKRVKHQQEIGLPCLELWKIYVEDAAAPMVKNFCIVYIEMAFERLRIEEKESMAPVLVATITKLPSQHQEIILRIIIKVVGECYSNRIDDEVAAKYRSICGSPECDVFLEFGLHSILYTLPSRGEGCPPALSIAQSNRVTGKCPMTSDILLIRKLGILNVVEAMKLAPELVYPLYLAACVDCQGPVAKKGEELLKRVSDVNLEDEIMINRLFLLFSGTAGVNNIDADSRIRPACFALRVKLMSTFCRSIKAANSFPSTLQCIFECIYGSDTTSRLKQLGMEFTVWVFKHARMEQLQLMGPVILTGILKSLDSYSISEKADALARDTKTFSFQAIGLLAPRMPQLFKNKIDMAVRLFNALKLETQFLRPIVQEVTNTLVVAYKGASEDVLKDLETLLLENSEVEQSEARFCAVRWATSLFDMQHCPSRYVCMLGAADSKLDIREMALEGLFPDKDHGQADNREFKLNYPKLGEMLDYIIQQQPKLLCPAERKEEKLIFPCSMFLAMINFLMNCFKKDVEHTSSADGTHEFSYYVGTMCLLLEHALAYEGSVELHAVASKSLITIGAHCPEMVGPRYAQKLFWLKQLLSHIDIDTRECGARMLGIASGYLPISASSSLIEEIISSIGGLAKSRFETTYGALCALGYVAADSMSRTPTIPEPLLKSALKCLVSVVNSENATFASVAMEAIGHIGLYGPLPMLVHDSPETILAVVLEKLQKIMSSDDIKAIQKILISLGHMCSKETSPSHLQIALNLVFSQCRSKVEDVLFAAGEALSFMWGGVPVTADVVLKTNYTSLSRTSNFLTRDVSPTLLKRGSCEEIPANEDHHSIVRSAVTTKIFNDLLYSSRKEERCAGTVWLLSLTLYCGHHPTIQQLLPEIQEAFSHLLGEQNELTQELASQGMSIVYEIGDASMKKSLVSALVNTLTGSGKRKRAVKLVDDSEVFQEGAIGESPSGGKLSTYKELCSLANDMGQPDLIYKFMDLANYQASLNSKRGAAFGFSKIAKQAGDALQPHLRLLVPKLVRYQYDPEKNVQDAMAHIWRSLVAEPKKTIDEHLDLIIEDLLLQCGSRLWRSREASCLALADIIQGRKFNQVGKYLKRLWTATFRAMDDIKETVRSSGEKLCRGLITLTIRLCDFSLTEARDASQAMDIVLPYLLAEGIMSKVENVRKESIAMVMKLAKGAGAALRPHLPDLVCCMLESLSSLEDQGLNYVELHAAKAGIQTDKLENLRLSVAKGSPMWETLDLCVDLVDSGSLDLLIPRLTHLVRSGVGLNTRVGVASFICLLVQKVKIEIKPFTSKLLTLLFPVVNNEKSIAAKRAFARSCALVMKYATPSQVEKILEDTAALHNGDRNCQISCAVLLNSYSSNAADVLSGYYAMILPVIFISRFEDDEYVSRLFEELWEDNTSGDRVTLQLYLKDIATLVCDNIGASSWAIKKKSAQAISKLGEVLGESLSPYSQILVTSLMKELPGRIWEGKDSVLYALGAVCTSCHKSLSDADTGTPVAILHAVSSACTKSVKKYREAALSCLDQVVKAFADPEFFNIVFPPLFEMSCSATAIESGKALRSADAGLTDDSEDASPRDKVLECLTSCVSVAHVNDVVEQRKNLMHMLLSSFASGLPWTVKMSVFSLVKEICSKLRAESFTTSSITSFVHELFHTVSPKVVECMNAVKIAQVHITAAECILEMSNVYRLLPSGQWTNIGFKAELLNQYELEKNMQAKSSLKNCISIIESLEQETGPTNTEDTMLC